MTKSKPKKKSKPRLKYIIFFDVYKLHYGKPEKGKAKPTKEGKEPNRK